jgi:hypothetical protein
MVNYTITADGANIEFPEITEIEGYPIVGSASSQSINMINGHTTRTTSKTYNFQPQKSVTIPSYKVKTDGKEYITRPLTVNIVKPIASQIGERFVLEMKLDKQEVYVGEGIDLSITFKRKINAHVEKVQLDEPKLEGFWVKKVDGIEHTQEGDYIVQQIHYQIFPQKSGEFTIPPLEILIGKASRQQRSFFGRTLDWKKVYSNQLKLTVKALPNGLELYGDYKIKATVDRQEIQANKPINLTITVEGDGNIDDVKKFDLTIDNTIIYSDEPKITSQLHNKIYQGTFTQKIAIIADRDFTIPSLKLKYFDKATQKVKTITTNPIDIKVTGGAKESQHPSSIEVSPNTKIETPKVKTITKVERIVEDWYIKYLFLLLGLIAGGGATYGFFYLKNKTQTKESDKVKAIKKAKGDRALFDLLLPYAKEDSIISNTLNKLEANLYRGAKYTIDREELLEFFEVYGKI